MRKARPKATAAPQRLILLSPTVDVPPLVAGAGSPRWGSPVSIAGTSASRTMARWPCRSASATRRRALRPPTASAFPRSGPGTEAAVERSGSRRRSDSRRRGRPLSTRSTYCERRVPGKPRWWTMPATAPRGSSVKGRRTGVSPNRSGSRGWRPSGHRASSRGGRPARRVTAALRPCFGEWSSVLWSMRSPRPGALRERVGRRSLGAGDEGAAVVGTRSLNRG